MYSSATSKRGPKRLKFRYGAFRLRSYRFGGRGVCLTHSSRHCRFCLSSGWRRRNRRFRFPAWSRWSDRPDRPCRFSSDFSHTFCFRLRHRDIAVVSLGTNRLMDVAVRPFGDGVRAGQSVSQRQRDIFVNRTGMRFFLLHAQFRQQVENDARFYFELPRQLVNSDFLHRRNCYLTPYTADT
jgi:hypothetical protein